MCNLDFSVLIKHGSGTALSVSTNYHVLKSGAPKAKLCTPARLTPGHELVRAAPTTIPIICLIFHANTTNHECHDLIKIEPDLGLGLIN